MKKIAHSAPSSSNGDRVFLMRPKRHAYLGPPKTYIESMSFVVKGRYVGWTHVIFNFIFFETKLRSVFEHSIFNIACILNVGGL
jgi:hypothetical protein